MKNKVVPLMVFMSLVTQVSLAQNEVPGSSTLPRVREVTSDSELKPHFGLKMGFASPEGSQRSAGVVGFDVGYQPLVPIGLGLEYSAIDSSLDRSYALVKAAYNFGGENALLKYSYVGLGFGSLFKTNGTDFVSAPGIGFDIPLERGRNISKFSLGASAQYLISASREPDFLAVDAVVKYWY